jgi:LuxR family maltose regulon positive regulatory protein
MAQAETGAFDDASKTLRGAMSLACPDALYSPFFELCPTGWAMLDKASREEPGYQSFVSAIRKYGRRLDGARNQAKNDADIFTKREMEIVSLLQSGLKNKEIADTLHISENTVKAFLKKIFLKKGIASRKCLAKGKHP